MLRVRNGAAVVLTLGLWLSACTEPHVPEAIPVVEDAGPSEREPEAPPAKVSEAGAPVDAGPPPITAEALLAKLTGCATKVSTAPYAKDSGGTANIDVCSVDGAIYFHADLDVDCDGKTTDECNKTADPSYQASTAGSDSTGKPLDAAALPFVVVPGVSSRWSYKASGIAMGTVALVVYGGKVAYGVVGDVGPTSIIGEASYAMAETLGIDPDPKTGGTASGVTYVLFPGVKVSKLEDHDAAVALGEARARELLAK